MISKKFARLRARNAYAVSRGVFLRWQCEDVFQGLPLFSPALPRPEGSRGGGGEEERIYIFFLVDCLVFSLFRSVFLSLSGSSFRVLPLCWPPRARRRLGVVGGRRPQGALGGGAPVSLPPQGGRARARCFARPPAVPAAAPFGVASSLRRAAAGGRSTQSGFRVSRGNIRNVHYRQNYRASGRPRTHSPAAAAPPHTRPRTPCRKDGLGGCGCRCCRRDGWRGEKKCYGSRHRGGVYN